MTSSPLQPSSPPTGLESVISILQKMDQKVTQNFQVLYNRTDDLDKKVDNLGRRVDVPDSSSHIKLVTTHNDFLRLEEELEGV